MTVGAILPALNAARFLPGVIDEIRRRHPDLRVLTMAMSVHTSTSYY